MPFMISVRGRRVVSPRGGWLASFGLGAIFAIGQASATPAVMAMISHQGTAADQPIVLRLNTSVLPDAIEHR